MYRCKNYLLKVIFVKNKINKKRGIIKIKRGRKLFENSPNIA